MMKRPLVAALVLLYPLVAFGAAKTDGVDTASLENAKTIEELTAAYQTSAQAVIQKYKSQNVDQKELDAANKQVTENITSVTEAQKDGSLDDALEDTTEPTLSEEDSLAQIEELQANADAMREKEQSFGNRMVGGTAMGTMGIGGQMIGSALAEQSADSDAEMDMAAYLATFKCDYGAGKNIAGGTLNVELPGANILLPIYTEYVTLAADLKTRKEALGMAPGIESNEILDAATSGLYDNVSTGVTGGAYASIARALMNPEGADAAAWAAQKAETSEQLKAGAITAGVGALVGISGNVLLNEIGPNKVEERSDEIMSEYDKKRRIIREELEEVEEDSLEQQITEAPDVEPFKISEAELACQSVGMWDAELNTCHCNNGNPWDFDNLVCKGDEIINDNEDNCVGSGGTWGVGGCMCPDGYTLNPDNGRCYPDQPSTQETEDAPQAEETESSKLLELYNESLFGDGVYKIENSDVLNEVIETFEENAALFTDYSATLYLIAHTDRDDVRKNSSLCQNDKICDNNALSEARADSVKNYLEEHWPSNLTNVEIETQAAGEKCADQSASTDDKQKLDRKVVFYLFFEGVEADQDNYKQLRDNPCYKLDRNSSTVSEAVRDTNVLKKLFNNMA